MTNPYDDAASIAHLLADLETDQMSGEPGPDVLSPHLRARLFETLRDLGAEAALPARADLPAAACAYAEQVRELDRLLAGLSTEQWHLWVVNSWTADRVLGHLLAVDALAAAALGLPTPAETGHGPDVRSRTLSVHAALSTAPPSTWRRVWRAQAVALLRHASAVGSAGLERPVDYLGVSLTAADVLLDRGFETWVHTEDVCAALGVPLVTPDPRDLHQLADLGVRMLPRARTESSPFRPSGSLAVELTGPGGGAWIVSVDGQVRPGAQRSATDRATLRLDVIEFCRLAGGRRQPTDAVHVSDGEPALVADALAAVAALARL